MFSLFRKNKQQKSISKIFDEYLSEDNTVVNVKDKRQLQYILIFVHQNNRFDETLEQTCEIAIENDAVVHMPLISFVLLTFGSLRVKEIDVQNRRDTVEKLKQNLGENIAILHGQAECLTGSFGSKNIKSHGPLIEDIKQKMHKLAAAEYGEVIEE